MTRAPKALPSRMAVVPMPLEPPCTSSVSPWLQARALEHVEPDGEEGLRQRRGLLEAQRRRHRQALHRGQRSRTAHSRRRPPARTPALPAPARARPAPSATTSPATSSPGNVAGPRRRRVGALALQDVGAVDAGGRDANQHLAGGGLRARRAAPRAAPAAARARGSRSPSWCAGIMVRGMLSGGLRQGQLAGGCRPLPSASRPRPRPRP